MIVLKISLYSFNVVFQGPMSGGGVSMSYQVAHQDIELNEKEFILGYGKSKWVASEKVAKMERENQTGGRPIWVLGLACNSIVIMY